MAISVMAFRLVGDRILVNDPMPDRWFTSIPVYGQQWAGAAPFYAMQTTENKRMVKLFNMLMDKDVDKALDFYWEGQKGWVAAVAAVWMHISIPVLLPR